MDKDCPVDEFNAIMEDMLGTAQPEPVNLDAMAVDDVRAYAADKRNPRRLRAYAREKVKAMVARLLGDIPTALRHEHNCDLRYQDLPENLRSW